MKTDALPDNQLRLMGQRLAGHRTHLGWRRDALAERAHINVGTIYRLEKGACPYVHASTICALATALGVPTDWLLGMDVVSTP